jgi:hypothetical protein
MYAVKHKGLTTAVRILFGAFIAVHGGGMLVIAIVGAYDATPAATDRAGVFISAMVQTGYLWIFFGLYKLLTGILMLVPRTGPLAVIMAVPYSANILPWVIFVEKGFIGLGVLVFAVNCYLIYAYYDRYKSILAK